jgi:omega-6 fatty acid desaturase (delta-12 desaturase)
MTEAAAAPVPVPGAARHERPWWRDSLAPFAKPSLARSLADIATSVVPYLVLSAVMYFTLDVSYLIALALAPLAAGFLLRTYIIFHDCAHGSFFASKRANTYLGIFTGLLVWTPFQAWKHDHAVHHATSGDLDRRGTGDVPTFTVQEYYSWPWQKRLGYRLFRNPLIMFGLGPIYSMIVGPRIWKKSQRPRVRKSIIFTNVALLLYVGGLCLLMGPLEYLMVWGPPALLAGSAGVFLFYVQHQFEDAYWQRADDWSYADAALRGSSYLRLPKILQFFTGNIGLHHVHHLTARIPNYKLQAAHDANPVFHDVPTLTLWDGIKATRLKLYDTDTGRMLTWHEARDAHARSSRTPAPKPKPKPQAGQA